MNSVADVPTWLGILMCLVGFGLTVVMAKLVASREQRRNGMTSKS